MLRTCHRAGARGGSACSTSRDCLRRRLKEAATWLERNLPAKDLQRRRHEAKTGLLELAHRQGGFTIDEAVQLTGFDRIESEYLIGELLASQALKVEVKGGTLVYRSGRG